MKKKTVLGKVWVLMMTLVLSLSMLSGCGKSSDRTSDEVETEEPANSAGMVHLDSVGDVAAFMEDVYGGVAQDLLPREVQTTELDMGDEDLIEYHTGLTDLSGIEGIYLSESMMTSTAYSAVYIRTNDDADAAKVRDQLMESINPAKWICVTAENQYAVLVGNDIFFVMGAQDTAKEVMDNAVAAAQGRGMSTSEVTEKTNPI